MGNEGKGKVPGWVTRHQNYRRSIESLGAKGKKKEPNFRCGGLSRKENELFYSSYRQSCSAFSGFI
jgi:hypothetical protein